MRLLSRIFMIVAGAVAGGACTKYEFAIVDPPDLAGVVTSQSETSFTTASAEYRLRAVEGRLVMFIYNPESTLMQLTSKSVVVSADGASHPIIPQPIASNSFVKVILPPTRPQVEPDGPGVSFGFGVSSGGYYGANRGNNWAVRSRYGDRGSRYRYGPYRPYHGPVDGPYFYDPPSYTVYDASNPAYWDWRGETQVTLTLAYDRDGSATEDRFVIQRRRAN